jgi:acyl-CoA thioesterase
MSAGDPHPAGEGRVAGGPTSEPTSEPEDAPDGAPSTDQETARRSAEVMLGSDEASRSLGIELLHVGPGRARMRMRVTRTMVNGHDIAHGGLVFALADSAFAVACNSHGTVTVASGADITFVQPGRLGDVLVADAVEHTVFGRSGVTDVTVSRSDGEVVALFRGRSRSLGRPIAP